MRGTDWRAGLFHSARRYAILAATARRPRDADNTAASVRARTRPATEVMHSNRRAASPATFCLCAVLVFHDIPGHSSGTVRALGARRGDGGRGPGRWSGSSMSAERLKEAAVGEGDPDFESGDRVAGITEWKRRVSLGWWYGV